MKTLIVFGLVSSSVLAQTRILPPIPPRAHGNAYSSAPFAHPAKWHTFQQVMHGVTVANKTASITEMRLRRDGLLNDSNGARNIKNLRVHIGHASVDPDKLDRRFATNRAHTPQLVFQGALSLPAMPPAIGAPPFSIRLKFARPFQYSRNRGHLLFEIENPADATANSWMLDAKHWRSWMNGGGKSGTFSDASSAKLGPGRHDMRRGGSIGMRSTLTQAYPTFHAYGFSDTYHGVLPLPLDLTPFGAPGNHLYCSLDLLLPVAVTGGGTVFRGETVVRLPDVRELEGISIYGTSIHVERKANSLGLVFGKVVNFAIGASFVPSGVVRSFERSSQTGGIQLIALVAEFVGTFN